MGNGIAQVVAQSGCTVTIVDLDEAALERARTRIQRSLTRAVGADKLTQQDADQTLARIELSTALQGSGERADHVIETVVELLEVKQEVLTRLDEACREDVILASNTSQFPITTLAAATKRPDRVIGSHWFNPPTKMDLIEIICGVETSEQTLTTTLQLAERYKKQTIVCRKDTPGFITSRLIVTLALEAMRIVEEGIADVQDVNKACVLAFNHAMGPLDTMDFSGLDTALHVAENMTQQYGDRFLAPQNLRSLVNARHLGHKTGKGFTNHNHTN